MSEYYSSTLKYFWLAIREFTPILQELRKRTHDQQIAEKLDEMLEIYTDIAQKIGRHRLNYTDPNRTFDGEPHDIEINIPEKIVEELARLSLRMLNVWQEKYKKLSIKEYKTDANKREMAKLKNLIWPLEVTTTSQSSVIGKYAEKGPLEFPGENKGIENQAAADALPEKSKSIFPPSLLHKLPTDVKRLCEEFNFNYQNGQAHSGLLLLRKILPLSIVRKFQQLNRGDEIVDPTGDFMDTKALLGKIEGVLKEKRIYREIISYKALVDGSQHSYSLNVDMTDTEGTAIKIRIFLDDIF